MKNYQTQTYPHTTPATLTGYTVLAPEAADMDSVQNVEDMLDALTSVMLPKDTADAITGGTFVANNALHANEADHAANADNATLAQTANEALATHGTLTIGSNTFDGSVNVTASLSVGDISGANRIYYGTGIPTFAANNGDLYVRLYQE